MLRRIPFVTRFSNVTRKSKRIQMFSGRMMGLYVYRFAGRKLDFGTFKIDRMDSCDLGDKEQARYYST